MRRLLISLLVLVALLVVADRVSAAGAESLVASRVKSEQHLSSRPDVSIGGFPFLTQAISGRYDDVTLTLRHLRGGALAVDRLTVHLAGVHVSLGDVLSRRHGSVPVDRATAAVLLSYDDVNRFLAPSHVQVAQGADGRLHVTGTVTVAGRTLSASGEAGLSISGQDVVLHVGNGVDVPLPLHALPFRTRLRSAEATGDGIVVAASADGLVLHTG